MELFNVLIQILGVLIAYRIFLGFFTALFSGFGALPKRVLQKFKIHKSANGTPLVRVVGRAEGLISFILTIMGLSDQTHFELFEDRIFYRSNSLSLQIVNTVMLDHVNYTICTLYQPIWTLIIGGLFLIAAFFSLLAVAFVGSLLAFIFGILAVFSGYFFWTNRFLVMGIKTSSGDTFGIVFKRSIIENIEVDFGKVRNAMRLVDEKILAAK
ncbi:MAG: hypothetical protein ACOYNM_13465 [Gemmataceae bacterium]|jgi:hypothetical protein